MEREKRETVGNLKISQEVLATIANFSTKEIDGVASMAYCPASVNLKKLLTKSQTAKSINIEMNDDVAVIDVYVNLKYGAKNRKTGDRPSAQRNPTPFQIVLRTRSTGNF